ncbi:MAG: hypothetical protein DHS20C18_22930 [Saprospiraceae bacterium]|nr:MAG: hypothetical protein DHS20C18_22930 [Saprospiraceae bacterium]
MAIPKNPQNSPHKQSIADLAKELFVAIREWFRHLLDLREGMDREGTVIFINNNRRIQGANAWMLMCSIMIASLGLDLNSPAVIIGAMLISPLMSPILGIGLGVGINDRETLFLSLRHFGIAIVIALATSILYFMITPLGQLTEEINARTAPTFLDGLVAVFGGLAGIISTTRKDKSNAIPGVAIATALMPPLCVTGFGIANGQIEIALNSFYLFFLNSFFIALTTYLIIRLLKFPYRAYVNAAEARRTRTIILFFSLLIIIPSGFILRNVIKGLQNKQSINSFVSNYFPNDCISYRLFQPKASRQEKPTIGSRLSEMFSLNKSPKDSSTLVLQMLERVIPKDSFYHYEQIMRDSYFITNTRFRAIPDFSIELENFDRQLQGKLSGQMDQILDSLLITQERQIEVNKQHDARLDKLKSDSVLILGINQDVRILYKEITSILFSKEQITDGDQTLKSHPLLIINWEKGKRKPPGYLERLTELYTQRAKLDTLEIIER